MTVENVVRVVDRAPIGEAFERGFLARDVQMSCDGRAVVLSDLALVEDDGPGANTWLAPKETAWGPLQAKKVFRLERPQAGAARLVMLFEPFDGETAPLVVRVNGRQFQFTCTGGGWQSLELPPEVLRPGRNEVIFSCDGEKGWCVPIALREAILRNDPSRRRVPARSFRSTDGGRSWSTRLGDGSAVAGEYMVRLSLDQYAAQGELVGPVIDLAQSAAGGQAVCPAVSVAAVCLKPQSQTPAGTGIEYYVRSGTNPVCAGRGWGRWVKCDRSGRARGRWGRFVQWRAVLKTRSATATPALEGVGLEAEVAPKRPEWAALLAVIDSHNEDVRYTSIPFEYERFDEPQLVKLRKKYQLDRVVAGAKTELEKMIKLRRWVSRQFRWLAFGPPYFAWDAHEILERRSGVCVQFAIVYMQCALSLGMQTRFVFGQVPRGRLGESSTGGHEVNEFWSNEHGRWFYMDPRQDDCFADARTGLPANMLEVHDETLRLYFADRPISLAGNRFEKELTSPVLRYWMGDAPAPPDEPAKVPILWGCLYWMPRNNFYRHRYPEPLSQGRGRWSWPGYWRWVDDKSPRFYELRHHTSRRSDIDWTINQVRWAAALSRKPGTIEITMGTVTPDFKTFLVRLDGGPWKRAGGGLKWRLHPGKNRLQMRIRNRAGVLGKPSSLEVEYHA